MISLNDQRKWIDWGIASRPLAGEVQSGDLAVVQFDGDSVLLAAIDGVGHGEPAFAAANTTADILKSHHGASVIELLKHCHKGLTSTRGAVMTLASVNVSNDTLTWVGVGNVEARLFHRWPGINNPPERILLRGGLVGLELPAVQASTLRLAPGDLLVFVTDGIQPAFDEAIQRARTPQQIADDILNRHARPQDDALALAVRYTGRSS